MRLRIAIWTFCLSILCAEEPFPKNPELTSLTVEPSTIVGGHVNVLTGDFQDFEEDLFVPGPEPLHVQRCYCSSSQDGGIFQHHWASNHEIFTAFYESDADEDDRYAKSTQVIRLPLGQSYHFEPKKSKSKDQEVRLTKEFLSQGFTNTSQGVISGQTNPNNMTWIVKNKKESLKLGNGREIHFEKDVAIEHLPTGNRYEYRRGEHPKREVILYNGKNQKMGAVTYDGPTSTKGFKADPHVVALSPDGRKACYRFTPIEYWVEMDKVRSYLLQNVERSDKPNVSYQWESMPYYEGRDRKICKIERPQQRNLACQYYKVGVNGVKGQQIHLGKDHWMLGRVAVVSEPIGSGPELLPSYQFIYAKSGDDQEGCTGVYDALGYKTDYSYTPEKRLKAITKFDEQQTPYTQETLYWGEPNTRQQTHLKARTFRDLSTGQILFSKAYHYDGMGNVVHEELVGNLTGRSAAEVTVDAHGYPLQNGCDRLIKSFEYSNDHYHLLTREKCGAYEKSYVYQANSNKLLACFHQENGKIFLRHFYAYDPTGQIIEHIVDDGTTAARENLQGVTERKIQRTQRTAKYPIGLPEEVVESYLDQSTGTERLLRRTVKSFNALGLVTLKQVYDENNALFSSEAWSYDNHGNMLSYTNALNERWIYAYDANDNQISEHSPDGLNCKRFSYDYMNRLIRTEYHGDGKVLVEKTSYDLVGNPIATTDIHGNVTEMRFDTLRRPIEVIAPAVEDIHGNLYRPITKTSYDAMNLPKVLIDPEGNETRSTYTLHGKITSVQFPDGSQERFFYDLEGKLVETISKSGVRTLFTLDVQGRPIRKQVFDADEQLLYETQSGYNAFHLLWESDPEGVVTSYRYDGSGRRIAETTDDRLTTFTYNAQGLLEKTCISSRLCPEEAVVQVSLYDLLQRPIECRQETLQGDILRLERYGYDCEGNRIREERESEAGLSIITTRYDALGIPRERIDPMGRKGIAHYQYDFMNEQGQRVGLTETIDPLGQTMRITEDALGRIALSVKLDPQGKEIQRVRFKYNSMGKCLQTESSNPLVDGDSNVQIIRWEYDGMGRVVSQIEGFGTAEQKTISYKYHHNGHISEKVKPDGVKITYLFDAAGRLKETLAPDVHYIYHYDANGQVLSIQDLITHKETLRQYDALGNVIEETLANGLCLSTSHAAIGGLKACLFPDQTSVRYQYHGGLLKSVERIDAEGQILYNHQYTQYDLSGNLLKSSLIYSLGEQSFAYDLNGATVSFQSSFQSESIERNAVGNVITRKSKDQHTQFKYDALYQLAEESGVFQDSYSYDSRLNRVAKNGKNYRYNALNQLLGDGETEYHYDPSGNLIQEGKNRYSYDSFNRLIALETSNTIIRYEYDPFDRCVGRQEYQDGKLIQTRRFLYLNQEEVGSVSEDGTIQELRILGKGIQAEIGAAIAIELKGRVYLPQHDYLGNLTALVSHSGVVCESYAYSAFGESKIFDAFGQEITDSALGNPWRYASKRHDGSFVHFGLRWYLPRIGRWTTTDPAGYDAGPNPYCYLRNNPLSHVDAFGLKEDSINLYDRTHDRSSWEYGSPGANYAERDSKCDPDASIFAYTGLLWRHIVPIPPLQDLGCSIMHYLNHGSLNTFKPWRASKTTCDPVGNRIAKRIVFVYIAGVNTSRAEVINQAKIMSEQYGGVQVYAIHNGDHGLLADLLEAGCQIIDIPVRSTDFTYDFLRGKIEEIGGAEGNVMFKIRMFSQGALTGEKAFLKLRPAERKLMHINTYGPASIIPAGDYLYVKNSISSRDCISCVSLPNFIAGKIGFLKEVKFLPARETYFGIDHKYMSETYQMEMEEDAKLFMDEYRDWY
jgi:RHS repeat-associated protein